MIIFEWLQVFNYKMTYKKKKSIIKWNFVYFKFMFSDNYDKINLILANIL